MSDRKAKLAEKNHWDELLSIRDEQRERARSGLQVIKEKDLPLEVNRQGLMRWYLHPSIKDTVLQTMMFYQQEIPPGSRSGRLKCQGGQVLMILDGKGYTLALLMPGRLMECNAEQASRLRRQLRLQCKYILAYAYGDWLSRYEGLTNLLEKTGFVQVGKIASSPGVPVEVSFAEVAYE